MGEGFDGKYFSRQEEAEAQKDEDTVNGARQRLNDIFSSGWWTALPVGEEEAEGAEV